MPIAANFLLLFLPSLFACFVHIDATSTTPNLFSVAPGAECVLIVQFDGYYDALLRRSLLPSGLPFAVERRPLALSDFDAIRLECAHRRNFTVAAAEKARIVRVDEQRTQWRSTKGKPNLRPGKTAPHHLDIRQIADLLRADRLWMKGFKGEGVDVAVFDTGLTRRRTFFRNVKTAVDFTSENNAGDRVGHGTFVAGLIASSRRHCSGIAPLANLHIYKVFTSGQISCTAWFLDAFNLALQSRVNVINLSIGGPDFTDQPFMAKVREVTAAGIVLISAIGNDGPTYGTLNNPADQPDVIGVGGINVEDRISRFSSRGMTTWELPAGYGRVKPDLVTYGAQVFGASLYGGCRVLSGTSVAAPVVSGAVALLLSSIAPEQRRNVAMVKQVLMEGAVRLDTSANIFEQGSGKLDIAGAFVRLQQYTPRVTLFPSYIDFLDCPYMWPYCRQPVYAGALPTIFNVTILNGFGVEGHFVQPPVVELLERENGELLDVGLSYSERLWPWSGFVAVSVRVRETGRNFTGIASFQVKLQVISENGIGNAVLRVRVSVVPTPPKQRRLLWDQFRNMRYPPGYFARDDLRQRTEPLDWNADHPHTNFRALFHHLRERGFFLEVLGEPATCVDLRQYAAYLLVDPEEEFFPTEVEAIQKAVGNGTRLVVFADWFNATLVAKIQFLDDNTKQWSSPETGGCNVPALNALLTPFGFAVGDTALEGTVHIGGNAVEFLSGSAIMSAPQGAWVAEAELNNIGAELIYDVKKRVKLPVFATAEHGEGVVSVFGDSNCLEVGSCFAMLDQMLDPSVTALPTVWSDLVPNSLPALSALPLDALPARITNSNFKQFSSVISDFSATSDPVFRPLPSCRQWLSADRVVMVANLSFPPDFRTSAAALDVIEVERLLGPRLLSNFDALVHENAADLPDDDYAVLFEDEYGFVRSLFLFLLLLFLLGALLVAKPRGVQLVLQRPLRVLLAYWYRR